MFDQKFAQDPAALTENAPEDSPQSSAAPKDTKEKEPEAWPCKNSLPT